MIHTVAHQLYPKDATIIGDECEAAAVYTNCLEKEQVPPKDITEMMVYELELYRSKQGRSGKDLLSWLGNLLGHKQISSVNNKSILSTIQAIKRKKQDADHKKKKEILIEMTQTLFVPSKTNVCVATGDNKMLQQYKADLMRTKQKNRKLQLEVNAKHKELENTTKQLTKACKDRNAQSAIISSQTKQTAATNKVKKELKKRKRELDNSESRYKPRNVERRESTMMNTIQKLEKQQKDSKARLQGELTKTKKRLEKKLDDQTRSCLSRRYFVNKSKSLHDKLSEVITLEDYNKLNDKYLQLKQDFATLQIKHFEKELEIDHLREKNKPVLKEGGRSGKTCAYSDDVHDCYMRLASLGVSSKKLSKVAVAVLRTIAHYDISESDLPKATFRKTIPSEANVISTIQVANEMKECVNATIHSDGTTRDGVKVVDFEVTVGPGKTRTMGITEVGKGDADTQLSALLFNLEKLVIVTQESEETSEECKKEEVKLLSKIKNTMGDQAATQKSFNAKLEAYRSEVVPAMMNGWDELGEEIQVQILTMNHFYCNLHILIGMATYCDKGLKQLEETVWAPKFGRLGAEANPDLQNTDGSYRYQPGSSATQRLARTACEALAPGGNQQANAIGRFKTYREIHNIKLMKMASFRANRFNCLFDRAAGVYYHRLHIVDALGEGFIDCSTNNLLKAVLDDSKSLPLLAGLRALGILHKQLTEPYWLLCEHRNVQILDFGPHIQNLYQRLDSWKSDASPLLSADFPPIFVLADGEILEPVKDEVFMELYANQGEQVDTITKEALEVMAAEMMILLKRRFVDQLEGQYSGNIPQHIREETQHTMKTNKRGENDFAYWAHVKETKPTQLDVNIEGTAMFSLNYTDKYLDHLRKAEPLKYTKVIRQGRRLRKKVQGIYHARAQENKISQQEHMLAKQRDHERKKAKKTELVQSHVKFINDHGGECKTPDDVSKFASQFQAKTAKRQGLNILMQYIKHKYRRVITKLRREDKSLATIGNKTIENIQDDTSKLLDLIGEKSKVLDAEVLQQASTVQSLNLEQLKTSILDNSSAEDSSVDVAHKLKELAPKSSDSECEDQTSDSEEDTATSDSEDDTATSDSEDDTSASDSEDDDDTEPPKKKAKMTCWKRGDYIIAAWTVYGNWFPGIVSSVISDEMAIVKYFVRSKNKDNIFVWPPDSDIQTTHTSQVLAYNVDMFPCSNLRFHQLNIDINKMNQEFAAFSNSS
ncbi:uncharacterized protein LOC119724913 [Patiria miniata]|uniref:Uncharacterized protein n=1 Tax=Patiria miniata TaxID=46514 RepID=A0A913ZLE7_PATMI|nr:uncharacterized protein LOC119724913 [Patiria miniata]